jgi:hypothetical protein
LSSYELKQDTDRRKLENVQWAYEIRCVKLAFQKNINFVVGSFYAFNDPLLKNMQRRPNLMNVESFIP